MNTKPTETPAVAIPVDLPVGRPEPERMKFADVCALMPEGVHWGEHLTPQIARELVEAGAEWQRAQVPALDDAHAMGANGGPALEAERLAFEAWMAGHSWSMEGTRWDGDCYRGEGETLGRVSSPAMGIRRMWAAWRDRAALARSCELCDMAAEIARLRAAYEYSEAHAGRLLAERDSLQARVLDLQAVHEDASGAVLAERERWKTAFDEARDAVLNGRGPLEGEGFQSEQTNAVLDVLDDAFAGLV
jgi:hypothetical protein